MKFKIYATGDRDAVKALKAFTPAVHKIVRSKFRAIARSAADDARARAAWSVKIPPGITSGVTVKGPYIRYRGTAPEIGRLSELRDQWRHPLFGDFERWYTQRGRKFLQPAAQGKEEDVYRAAGEAIEQAKGEVGL